ncbi:hypothetical protein NOR_02678 [Metarhizium rileyi]|uniref:Uncharacterized protein n=1 Tax=Metarhizium rileyi (strain RCEF 4871) TaxID=1649241 RepID=A0A167GST3_METRR|nr:hypothetical protein NOR_02678 [Metarhizium rileyi RCEF 4871]TWU75156.1 hypothetical protein ED733_003832 [Metarhizium rileyi]
MDQSFGNPADLISNYFPVANYSYPRKDSATSTTPVNRYSDSRHSSNSSSRGRESLGSEGSTPGLIEDRTDSEVSLDDDYQYHAHTAELWDSFWPDRTSSCPPDEMHAPNKQYPALIRSPRVKKPYISPGAQLPPSWPLTTGSSAPSRAGTRRAAATYSPFPKMSSPPPTRMLPPVPVWKGKMSSPQRPSTSCSSTPARPPRPAEALLTPLLQQQSAFMPISSAMADYIITKDHDEPSPSSPTIYRRPTTSCGLHQSRSPHEAPPNRRSHCTIYSVVSLSATHLPVPEIRPSPTRILRHFKSLAALPRPKVEQEPHSVFEDDSESENGHTRKFFTFHRRSDSAHRRRRDRSNTTPAPDRRPVSREGASKDDGIRPLSSSSTHQKRHGHDMFGRLLGRRSR